FITAPASRAISGSGSRCTGAKANPASAAGIPSAAYGRASARRITAPAASTEARRPASLGRGRLRRLGGGVPDAQDRAAFLQGQGLRRPADSGEILGQGSVGRVSGVE